MWMAYDQLDPIGGERGDLQAGIIASTVFNCRFPNQLKQAAPAEWMPDFDDSRPKTTDVITDEQQMEAAVRAALGGGIHA